MMRYSIQIPSLLCYCMLLFCMSYGHGLTISTFDPTVVFYGTTAGQVATMDAELGIAGFAVEDFEDATLIPGLTIVYDALPESNLVLSTDLDPRALWDGSKSLLTNMQTSPHNIFNIAGGARSFGIGLGDIEGSDIHLYVNGQDYGPVKAMPQYHRITDNSREVYIRIDAGPSEIIHTVGFAGLSVDDGIFYDHIAVGYAVPEPGTWALFLAGMAFVFWRKKRRK